MTKPTTANARTMLMIVEGFFMVSPKLDLRPAS
jgi:hypothetical protein